MSCIFYHQHLIDCYTSLKVSKWSVIKKAYPNLSATNGGRYYLLLMS